ncbi:MAG: tail fiber domain-containing protein [Jhaorihella sp.]
MPIAVNETTREVYYYLEGEGWTLIAGGGAGDGNTQITDVSVSGTTLTITESNGATWNVTLPSGGGTDTYTTAASIAGGNLILTRNNGLPPLTVALPVDPDSYVTGMSLSGDELTLTRNNGLPDLAVTLPSGGGADGNDYVDGVSISGGVLTLTRTGSLPDLTATLPADQNTTNLAMSVSGGVLTLSDTDGNNVSTTLPSHENNYVDTLNFDTGTRVLTVGRNGGLPDLTVTIPGGSGADGNNYVTGATVSGGDLVLTRNGGLPDITVTLPAATDTYATAVDITGTTLTISRNNGLPDLTATIPVNDTYVTSMEFDNTSRVLTLVRNNGQPNLTVTIPAGGGGTGDGNNYVTAATVDGSGNLVLSRNGGLADITVALPVAADSYVTGASVSSNVLTLTRNGGLAPITVTLPDHTDTNNYVDALSFDNGTRVLTVGRNGGLPDLTVTIPADGNNYVTSATIDGGNLVLTRVGLGDITVALPPDENNYVTGASVTGDTLTLTRSGGLSPVTVTLPAAGGDEVHIPINSYSGAQAGQWDSSQIVTHIASNGTMLDYAYDTATPYHALRTADGRDWSPANIITPMHFGAVGNGTTDDRAALQRMLDYVVNNELNEADAYTDYGFTVMDGLNKQYAVSGPLYIGNIGVSTNGIMANAKMQNFKLVAVGAQGNWDGTAPRGRVPSAVSMQDIPRAMLTVAWRTAEAYADNAFGLTNLNFENVMLDCGYRASGMYFENTNTCTVQNCRVARMGVNKIGYDTGRHRAGTALNHATGVNQGNGAMLIDNLTIWGNEEEVTEDFVSGRDQTTMNTIGMRHRTNDARIENVVIARCSQAMYINDCGAVQFNSCHPWSREVFIGANTNNLWFDDCYFDHTPLRISGAFGHTFNSCYWPLGLTAPAYAGGDAGFNSGLHLIATQPNTTAEGLVINGCTFSNPCQLYYDTAGSGSWVQDDQRLHIISGTHFDVQPTIVDRYRNNLIIRANGVVEQQKDDVTPGSVWMYGDRVQVGSGRLNTNQAGFDIQYRPGATYNSSLNHTSDGTLNLENYENNEEIHFKVSYGGVTSTALSVYPRVGASRQGARVYGYLQVDGPAQIEGGNLTMGGNRITNMASPTAGLHAANKNYVDSVASDIRIKSGIEPVSGGWGLSVIEALDVKWFDYDDAFLATEHGRTAGFIAQEMAKVYPAAVRERGPEKVTIDGEDRVIEDMLGVDYKVLVVPLVSAVQELTLRVRDLERKLSEKG